MHGRQLRAASEEGHDIVLRAAFSGQRSPLAFNARVRTFQFRQNLLCAWRTAQIPNNKGRRPGDCRRLTIQSIVYSPHMIADVFVDLGLG